MRSIHHPNSPHPRSNQRDFFPDLSRLIAAHPVGISGGALLGGAAGFLVASLFAGPTGTLSGVLIGALVGVVLGLAIAERHRRSDQVEARADAMSAADPNPHAVDELYFAERFQQADYREHGETFEDYKPAYRYGMQARARGASIWDEALERELAREWHLHRGDSKLDWDRARAGVYEAFSDEFNSNAPVNERFRVG